MTKVSIVLAVVCGIAWTTGIWPEDASGIWKAGMAASADQVALIPTSVPPLAVALSESAHLLLLGAGLFTAAALIRRPRRPM